MRYVPTLADSEVPEGEARVAALPNGDEAALCRVGGRIYAVENICTHDDGPLGEGKLDGPAIECPRHGARFDVRTGAVLRMPASCPVRTFPVKIENGRILVGVEED